MGICVVAVVMLLMGTLVWVGDVVWESADSIEVVLVNLPIAYDADATGKKNKERNI